MRIVIKRACHCRHGVERISWSNMLCVVIKIGQVTNPCKVMGVMG